MIPPNNSSNISAKVYGWRTWILCSIFVAEVMRVEVRLAVVVSLRPKKGRLWASRFHPTQFRVGYTWCGKKEGTYTLEKHYVQVCLTLSGLQPCSKILDTDVRRWNTQLDSLIQSRPSQLPCCGPQRTWSKNQHSISKVPNKTVPKCSRGTTIDPHDGQPWSMIIAKHFLKLPGVWTTGTPARFHIDINISQKLLKCHRKQKTGNDYPCMPTILGKFNESVREWNVQARRRPTKCTGEKELHVHNRGICLSNFDLQDPMLKKRKFGHQCLPIARILRGQFPFADALIPAKRFQHAVPLLAWATNTRFQCSSLSNHLSHVFSPMVSSTKNACSYCMHVVRIREGGENIMCQCVNAWTPCGGPVLGAGGEPNKTDIDKSLFTNLYLKRVPVPFPLASCIRT